MLKTRAAGRPAGGRRGAASRGSGQPVNGRADRGGIGAHHDENGRYVPMPTCGGCIWQSPNGLYCTWPCCEKGERRE